jgi:hypothetical protein
MFCIYTVKRIHVKSTREYILKLDFMDDAPFCIKHAGELYF